MKRVLLIILFFIGAAVSTIFAHLSMARTFRTPSHPVSEGLELVEHVGGGLYTAVANFPHLFAVFGSRLSIFDISDPGNLQEMGRLMLPINRITKIAVQDELVFAANGAQLLIINAANPAHPYIEGEYTVEPLVSGANLSIHSIVPAGDNVYLAFDEAIYDANYYFRSGLVALNVANPVQPVPVSYLYIPDKYMHYDTFIVRDNIAYWGLYQEDSLGYLSVVDLADPTHLAEIGTYANPDFYMMSALETVGDYLIAGNGELDVLNVSVPQNPTYVGGAALDSWVEDLAIVADYVYVLMGNGSLSILDLADPAQPGQTFSTTLAYSGWHMSLAGDYAYIVASPYAQSGVKILDVSNPVAPLLTGSYDEPATAYGTNVQLFGGYIYVNDYYNDPAIFKTAVDGKLHYVGTTEKFPWVMGGETAVTPDLAILDMSNPLYPAFIGGGGDGGRSIVVDGSYAYAGTPVFYWDYAYFRVVDISDPAAPVLVGQYPFNSAITDLAVLGHYAYILTENKLAVLDITNLQSPQLITTIVLSNPLNAIELDYSDGWPYFYVTSENKLYQFRLSNPAQPDQVEQFTTHGSGKNMVIYNDKLYLAHPDWGLEVWAFSYDWVYPIAYYRGGITDLAVNEAGIYAVGNGGLYALRALQDDISASIDSTGGNLLSTAVDTDFLFGSGTFTETAQLHYRQFKDEPTGLWGLAGVGHHFELTGVYSDTQAPINMTMQPYTVTIDYGGGESTAVPATLTLYYWNGQQWEAEPSSSINVNTHTLTATLSRFGEFVVLGETYLTYLPDLWHNTSPAGYKLVLPLDEMPGDILFRDGSGYGHDGTCTGTSCPAAGVAGVRGTAVTFDGQNDTIYLGDPKDLRAIRQEITLAAWIKPESSTGIQNIISHGYTLTPKGELYLRIADGQYQAGAWDGMDHVVVFSMPVADVGKWVHLATVYDGTTWRLYRNGEEVNASADAIGAPFVYGDWAIGSRGDGTERFFKGSVDEVVVYGRALSSEEIHKLFESR